MKETMPHVFFFSSFLNGIYVQLLFFNGRQRVVILPTLTVFLAVINSSEIARMFLELISPLWRE